MSKVTSITKEASPAETDVAAEAAIHLGYISAIADLVRTLDNVAGNENGLAQLEPGTLEAAMELIQHHVGAVDEMIQKFEGQADAGRHAVANEHP